MRKRKPFTPPKAPLRYAAFRARRLVSKTERERDATDGCDTVLADERVTSDQAVEALLEPEE